MRVGVIGINHKSAELNFREIFAKLCSRRFGHDNSCHGEISYILLSTCNRTEVYFSSPDLAETHTYFLGILRGDLEEVDFEHRLYAYFGEECFYHLARVTCGMDSALLGETEIQGQVKKAYLDASSMRKVSKDIHFMFQKCLKIGKDVRTSFDFTSGMPTLEEALFSTAEAVLPSFLEKKILFVGASQINQKIFSFFKKKGVCNIAFCNRSTESLLKICPQESVIPWVSLDTWHKHDLVIFGTKAQDYLISKQHLPSKLNARRLIIDLAVPRNVDPKLGRHPFITLLNIDQIIRFLSRKQKHRAQSFARIEAECIANLVAKQTHLFKAKEKPAPLKTISIA